MKKKMNVWTWIGWAFLVLFCIITLLLFFVVFLNSFKSKSEVFADIWSLPTQVSFDKFPTLLTEYNFGTYKIGRAHV